MASLVEVAVVTIVRLLLQVVVAAVVVVVNAADAVRIDERSMKDCKRRQGSNNEIHKRRLVIVVVIVKTHTNETNLFQPSRPVTPHGSRCVLFSFGFEFSCRDTRVSWDPTMTHVTVGWRYCVRTQTLLGHVFHPAKHLCHGAVCGHGSPRALASYAG